MNLTSALNDAPAEVLAFLDAERAWLRTARQKQILPLSGWARALALAGRGCGKTETGANWVRRCVGLYPGCVVHVVAPTYSDLRGVVFNGLSGILARVPRAMIADYNQTTFEIRLRNSSLIRGFSSESPDRLRGPQCTFLWGDEVAAWYRAEENLANIDMSTRIAYRQKDGTLIQPQRFFTTTPRPLAWLKKMMESGTLLITGSTYENKDNLATTFFDEITQYEGTAIGRQEIHGELLDISESAIIKKSWLQLWPNDRPLPYLEYVMVSMDTAFTERTYDKKTFTADPTACGVWGVFKYNRRWNLILLECWSEHVGFPNLVDRAKKEMKAVYGERMNTLFQPLHGPAWHQVQKKRPDVLIIENKGSGISLRQMMEQEGVPTVEYNPGSADKMARLHAVSHIAKHGRIWLPESMKRPGEPRDWIQPMLDELCVYSGPGTTPHDDWIDMCSQTWRVFADMYVSDGVHALLPEESVAERPVIPDPTTYGGQQRDVVMDEDNMRYEPRGEVQSPYG